MTQISGLHFICTYSGCDQETLDNPSILETLLRRTATLAGTHPKDSRFVGLNPNGVTGKLILTEGYIGIQTVPETFSARVELFTHASADAAEKALVRLHELLGASHYSQKSENRTRPLVNEPDLKV